ncbi:MAG TPA: major capsid protein [Bacillota bacterium]|nr:major capsid protein [Bacillota bacterium]
MAKTAIADIIVPSVFAPYALERTATLSEIVQSGIAGLDPEFDELAKGPGKTVDMPFWKDLTGSSEVLSDSVQLTPEKITTGQDTAAVHNRGKAWGANLLAKMLAGDDPMRRIADLVAGFWARDLQTMMLQTLAGLFDNTNGVLRTTHRLNLYSDVVAGSITDAMRLTGESFVDATVKLGDLGTRLTAVAMHSEVEAFLRKRELIDFIPDSEGKPTIRSFQGRRVVIDDGCPKVAGTNAAAYTTYLFGAGALALGHGALEAEDAVETERNALAGDEYLVNRKRFILHPRGVRWVGTPAGASPTNAELAAGANWAKVYSDKNIRIEAVKHNV